MAQQQSVDVGWTQEHVRSLAAAIAQGVLSVDYGTYRTTYRSLADMQRTLDRMTRYVTTRGDGQPPPNFRGSVFVQR